jgi:hypothetical protein
MNCGQCKKELPDEYVEDLCPYCGKDWRSDESPLVLAMATVLKSVLFGILILAGLIMLVLAILFAGCLFSSGGHL